MASWNPALRYAEDEFDPVPAAARFTVAGVALKTIFMMAIMGATFAYTWHLTTAGYSSAFMTPTAEGTLPTQIDIPNNVIGLAVLGLCGAFAVSMFTIFVQRAAPITGPIYAALEGLVLGAISAGFEAKFPGIVMEAVASTFGIFTVMLTLYATGIMRENRKLSLGVLVAMMGVLIIYLVDIVMHSFGTYVPVVHEGGFWGIAFSVLVCGLAAYCFIMDFEEIKQAAEDKAPKWYEWYAGFSLLLTFVWLYLELLRLWAKSKE